MSSIFDGYTDILSSLSQDTSAQKAQLAQYAIQAAAQYMQNNNYDGAVKEFKKATNEVTSEIHNAMDDNRPPPSPPSPLQIEPPAQPKPVESDPHGTHNKV